MTEGRTAAVAAVQTALGESANLLRRVAAERAEAVAEAAEVVGAAIGAGGKVLVFGNGGSATDAQHFAAELVGRFVADRRALPAIALTADSAVVTSVGNDYGYEAVFVRQIEALGRRGDVAIGITTSGVSPNVNAALDRARTMGLRTIGITGRDGGRTGRIVDVHVNVPHESTARIQEAQRTILHAMCQLVEAGL